MLGCPRVHRVLVVPDSFILINIMKIGTLAYGSMILCLDGSPASLIVCVGTRLHQ